MVQQRRLPREAPQESWRGLPVEEPRQGCSWKARLEAVGLALGLERLFLRREVLDLVWQCFSWGELALLFPPPGRR